MQDVSGAEIIERVLKCSCLQSAGTKTAPKELPKNFKVLEHSISIVLDSKRIHCCY